MIKLFLLLGVLSITSCGNLVRFYGETTSFGQKTKPPVVTPTPSPTGDPTPPNPDPVFPGPGNPDCFKEQEEIKRLKDQVSDLKAVIVALRKQLEDCDNPGQTPNKYKKLYEQCQANLCCAVDEINFLRDNLGWEVRPFEVQTYTCPDY